jgi:hypothetical protein
VKYQNELRAMHTDLPIHMVVSVQQTSTIQMRDKMYDQDLDTLSMYGQGDLLQSVFVVGETLVELESENHFPH